MAGGTFSVVKDEEGLWNLMPREDLPEWVNALSVNIKEAILENEEFWFNGLTVLHKQFFPASKAI